MALDADQQEVITRHLDLVRAVVRSAMEDAALKVPARSHRDSKQDRKRVSQIAAYKRQAVEWLLSNERYPYSFVWCCEYLELDESFIRASLARNGVLRG